MEDLESTFYKNKAEVDKTLDVMENSVGEIGKFIQNL